MFQFEIYTPGQPTPVDLVGLADHLLTVLAVGEAVQLPDYFLLDVPTRGVRTEIKAAG